MGGAMAKQARGSGGGAEGRTAEAQRGAPPPCGAAPGPRARGQGPSAAQGAGHCELWREQDCARRALNDCDGAFRYNAGRPSPDTTKLQNGRLALANHQGWGNAFPSAPRACSRARRRCASACHALGPAAARACGASGAPHSRPAGCSCWCCGGRPWLGCGAGGGRTAGSAAASAARARTTTGLCAAAVAAAVAATAVAADGGPGTLSTPVHCCLRAQEAGAASAGKNRCSCSWGSGSPRMIESRPLPPPSRGCRDARARRRRGTASASGCGAAARAPAPPLLIPPPWSLSASLGRGPEACPAVRRWPGGPLLWPQLAAWLLVRSSRPPPPCCCCATAAGPHSQAPQRPATAGAARPADARRGRLACGGATLGAAGAASAGSTLNAAGGEKSCGKYASLGTHVVRGGCSHGSPQQARQRRGA
jgi:hypothetical protein